VRNGKCLFTLRSLLFSYLLLALAIFSISVGVLLLRALLLLRLVADDALLEEFLILLSPRANGKLGDANGLLVNL
jgi:hypothetical protein